MNVRVAGSGAESVLAMKAEETDGIHKYILNNPSALEAFNSDKNVQSVRPASQKRCSLRLL